MLLARIFDPLDGVVRIDGTDLRDIRRDDVRRSVGVVTQDPHLYHDTIENNLRFARPGATPEEIVEACRAACIVKLIDSLPDGYQTLVGDRGYRLSGGEKQRLAIARMLLKDPAIVVLDEATSHLDSETEADVRKALTIALLNRTCIVIAHRLSTVIGASQILVVESGRIVERGTHAELIELSGAYRELYQTQLTPTH
jgi:ATP-binding cassette subfamily B protein